MWVPETIFKERVGWNAASYSRKMMQLLMIRLLCIFFRDYILGNNPSILPYDHFSFMV